MLEGQWVVVYGDGVDGHRELHVGAVHERERDPPCGGARHRKVDSQGLHRQGLQSSCSSGCVASVRL